MRSIILLSGLFLFCRFSFAQSFSNGFGFYLPPDDSLAVDFLPAFPAEPIQDFIGINPDGRFVKNGQLLRFWGVNVTYGACFPLKSKAAFIAARMRKMGINLVRFHHMDNPWTDQNGTIFNRSKNTTRELYAPSLDRMHYLLAQMKRNGIYANINLHVSRTFTEADGIADADYIQEFGKAVTYFDRELIDLQKEYARQLLTAVNPYTGLRLADDPVMAMVEITNENSLYAWWKEDRLRAFDDGGSLLPRHADSLDQRWISFLQNKYADQTALENAWNSGATNPANTNQTSNGDFETGTPAGWNLSAFSGAEADFSLETGDPFEGDYCGKIEVTRVTGVDWHIEFQQLDMTVQAGKSYKVKFAMKASDDFEVYVYAMRHNNPWTWYNGTSAFVGADWREFEFTFSAPEDNDGQVRLAFNFNNNIGDFWIDNVSFEDAQVTGLGAGESLVAGNIRRIGFWEKTEYSGQRVADMAAFYLGIQKDFYDEMYAFLKNELGVKVPVTGTNALTGPGDVYSMQNLDYVDDHNYWDHPWFPNGWSLSDWYIENISMLKDWNLGTISGQFSGLAVKNKPYTISEYRHPFPNRYEAEMMPVLTAYASFHNADGLMFFEYNDAHDNWEEDRVNGFFGIHRNTVQMALSPLYSYAFRHRLIGNAQRETVIDYSPASVFDLAKIDNYGRWSKFVPYGNRRALRHALKIGTFDAQTDPDFDNLPDAPANEDVATTNDETQIQTERGILKTVAPRFISVAGFINQSLATQAGDLEIAGASDFGALTWLSLTEETLKNSPKSVLAIASKVQNTGMLWEGTNTIRDQWGSAPTEMAALQVSLILSVDADSLQIFSLSATGEEGDYETFLPLIPGKFFINIDQSETQTTWFGIRAFGTLVKVESPEPEKMQVEVFPNPAFENLVVAGKWQEGKSLKISLLDATGKEIFAEQTIASEGGNFQKTFPVGNFPSGLYLVKIQSGENLILKKVVVR